MSVADYSGYCYWRDTGPRISSIPTRRRASAAASELFRLLAEQRDEIPGPLVWRKERNDDLP
jgi:hypothetical protein